MKDYTKQIGIISHELKNMDINEVVARADELERLLDNYRYRGCI